MGEAKDKILELLHSLQPGELGQVKAALAFKSDMQEAQQDDRPDLSSDWVFAGLVSYLVRRGLVSEQGIYGRLKKRSSYKVYLSKLPALMGYVVRLEQQVNTKTKHRPKLAYIFAKALGTQLERQGIFCVKTMLEQIDRIPEAVEQSYPGYVAAGLFRFVLDQKGDHQ